MANPFLRCISIGGPWQKSNQSGLGRREKVGKDLEYVTHKLTFERLIGVK